MPEIEASRFFQDVDSFEPVRDVDGNPVMESKDYPFTCIEIILTDTSANPLPYGDRTVRSCSFNIKGRGLAEDLNPLLVRKVEIGYPKEPYLPVTLKGLRALSLSLVLDYGLAIVILLPIEASIDEGRLRWACTRVQPVIRVWSYVPVQKEGVSGGSPG